MRHQLKLHWESSRRSSDDRKIEVKVETLFFVIRLKESNEIYHGQLLESADSEAQEDLHSGSLSDQFESLLGEIKRKGHQKADLEIVVLYQKDKREACEPFFAEIKRFGVSGKARPLSSNTRQRILFNLLTGDLWLSRAGDAIDLKPNARPTRVLIVEDSLPLQKILLKVFSRIPGVEVIGVEAKPQEAAEKLKRMQPDFVSLDLKLDGGTGIDFLNLADFKDYSLKSGARCALITDCSASEHDLVTEAIARGASSFIQKPQAVSLDRFAEELTELVSQDVNVFRRNTRSESLAPKVLALESYKLLAIGSSTGGTEVVNRLLKGLPMICPPIVIVQHMPKEFTGSFAERLERESGKKVTEVTSLTRLKRNEAYLATGDKHLVIESKGLELYANVTNSEPVNRFRPSVSVLFDSIAKAALAPKTIAIILTGMGHDGAAEMLNLRRNGSLTIGQSKETCVVYGMPRAAAQLGALCHETSPEQMILSLGGRL